jgi:hypothetical protein
MSFDPSNYGDIQRAWVQRTNAQALDRERAQHRSMADASHSARLHALSAALRSMLEIQVDLWGRGFDPDEAAARLLPALLPLVRE